MRFLLAALLTASVACTASQPGDSGTGPASQTTGSPAPKGQKWFGESTSSVRFEAADGSSTCTERWDLDFEFYIDGAQITGQGDANLIRNAGCETEVDGLDFARKATILKYDVQGRAAPKRITLELIPTGPEGFQGLLNYALFSTEGGPTRALAVPTGGRGAAEGKAETEGEVPGQGSVTASHRFLMVCQAC